jgi:uncharacterized tellurite resistance protein B-like protein
MGIESFSHIIEFFGGGDKQPSETQKKSLVEEALLLTLSRATVADSNINPVEVEIVQDIFREVIGTEVSTKDIRVAAISDLYKEATLERYLSKVSSKISPEDSQMIVKSLARVIKVDGKVSPFEVDFFNGVVKALGLSPAQTHGLEDE